MAALTKRDILARRHEIVRVARENGAVAIRLFGSVARDEADATSDVDLLVMPATATPPFFPGGLIVASARSSARSLRHRLRNARAARQKTRPGQRSSRGCGK